MVTLVSPNCHDISQNVANIISVRYWGALKHLQHLFLDEESRNYTFHKVFCQLVSTAGPVRYSLLDHWHWNFWAAHCFKVVRRTCVSSNTTDMVSIKTTYIRFCSRIM